MVRCRNAAFDESEEFASPHGLDDGSLVGVFHQVARQRASLAFLVLTFPLFDHDVSQTGEILGDLPSLLAGLSKSAFFLRMWIVQNVSEASFTAVLEAAVIKKIKKIKN